MKVIEEEVYFQITPTLAWKRSWFFFFFDRFKFTQKGSRMTYRAPSDQSLFTISPIKMSCAVPLSSGRVENDLIGMLYHDKDSCLKRYFSEGKWARRNKYIYTRPPFQKRFAECSKNIFTVLIKYEDNWSTATFSMLSVRISQDRVKKMTTFSEIVFGEGLSKNIEGVDMQLAKHTSRRFKGCSSSFWMRHFEKHCLSSTAPTLFLLHGPMALDVGLRAPVYESCCSLSSDRAIIVYVLGSVSSNETNPSFALL